MTVALPLLLVSELLLALAGTRPLPVWTWALPVLAFAVYGPLMLHIHRKHSRTSRANAWDAG
jgi:hypothetical protein